jgi:hypothetical protein
MAQEQKESENSPNLEPVKHLSSRLQRKLLKREQRQRKHFRSSGKPYPLVTAQSSSTSIEAPARGSALRARRRLTLPIVSLVTFILLTFGLVGIAIATHATIWVFILILFVLVLFASAAVIINIAFNRQNFH